MMFEQKRIFISGGTGSWGQELTKQLLKQNPERIVIYSRCEENQVNMQREFADDRLKFVIGDVRDKEALYDAMYGVDYVFHAAALKHVPICENQVFEAIKTNIDGTRNIIDCSIKHKVKKFINISTDKVVNPANLYGLTKAIAEKLTIQANCQTKDTDFIVTRTGNVLGSNGSIVPYMIDQIKTKNKVKITDKNMVRFFLTLNQAIELLFYAIKNGKGGEIFVRDISAFKLIYLVELLIECYGNKDTEIEIIGIREGEKVNEALIAEYEVHKIFDNEYYVIYPQLKTGREYNNGEPGRITGLKSIDNLEDKETLRQLLKEGGLI
jgi:UDP-N-acetylglucosamine 4,6-dehydratase